MASRKGSRKASRKARKGKRKGTRKAGKSNWMTMVKNAHAELKRKDSTASLGDAMKLASSRR